jgi:hypothetical protein
MYKTIEAIYEDERVRPLTNDLIPNGSKILIIFNPDKNIDLDEKVNENSDLEYKKGTYSKPELLGELIETLKGTMPDGLEYERNMRQENINSTADISHNFIPDPIAWQRGLRDEWEERLYNIK